MVRLQFNIKTNKLEKKKRAWEGRRREKDVHDYASHSQAVQ